MLQNGWLKLHRSILNWEWYQDVNTRVVFLHLLLTVNIEDSRWKGIEVKRGSRVSSFENLAKETNLTINNVRTAIAHMESTGELTRFRHNKFTIFTIKNFEKYQRATSETQDSCQSNHIEVTSNPQQNKNIKENKEKKKEEERREGAAPTLQKPTLEDVEMYCRERSSCINPRRFFDFYEANGWKRGNQPIEDWRAVVRLWETTEHPSQQHKSGTEDMTQREIEEMNDYLSLSLNHRLMNIGEL